MKSDEKNHYPQQLFCLMLANLLTLNVLQQKTIGSTDSDGLQNPALGKASFRWQQA
jgi:hypothetical protein